MVNKKLQIVFLIILFGLGTFVRLYRFNNPIADWHSWRQADTAAVTWNFVRVKFDIFHPMYFDISNVQSGRDNPIGYRYVEFPLYNAITASMFMVFHGLSIEGWGRVVSIAFSLLGSLFLFLLLKRRVNVIAAWVSLLCSLFLPFNIYYGRTILPDNAMVSTMLGSFLFLDVWLDGFRDKKNLPKVHFLIFAVISLAASLLLKIYTVFYFPAFFVLLYTIFGRDMLKRKDLWVAFSAAILPIVCWRIFILSHPEGIPAADWLFNGNGIRFRPSFFRWIFYERLTKLISGYVNIIFVGLGVYALWKDKKHVWFFITFVLCALAYVCIIATGNVQHDYYQIVIMPAVAILMGFGASFLFNFLKRFMPQIVDCGIIGIILLLGFWLSWMQVRDYFNINNQAIVDAGIAIRKMTPKDAKIVAPYGGDTTLLYYTKRKGWPSFEHDLPVLIQMGADYLVLVNPQPKDYLIEKQYKLVSSSKDYLLFNLHKKL